MSYGLPGGTSRTGLDWNETTGYLEAVSYSELPVPIRWRDRELDAMPIVQVRGLTYP